MKLKNDFLKIQTLNFQLETTMGVEDLIFSVTLVYTYKKEKNNTITITI